MGGMNEFHGLNISWHENIHKFVTPLLVLSVRIILKFEFISEFR